MPKIKLWNCTFVRYSLVAVNSCLVDWVIFLILTYMGTYYIYAQIISRISGGVTSFIINKYWSYRSKKNQVIFSEGIRFIILYALSYILSINFLFIFVEYIDIPVKISKILSDGSIFIFNYFAMKFFVFLPKRRIVNNNLKL